MRGDVGREAWESLRSQRVERLPMGLLVRREAAGRGDLAQIGVLGVGRLVIDPKQTLLQLRRVRVGAADN